MGNRARKIDIRSIIDTLDDLYQRGVDFVDIVIEREEGEAQDTIGIYFNKGYMSQELADNFDHFDNEPVQSKIDIKLTDKDINDLI